jgi:hypothetical protein
MNYTYVILGILLVIILVFIYYNFVAKQTKVVSALSLNVTNEPLKIETLQNPTSTKYSFCIWVYVNSLKSGDNKIFSVLDGKDSHYDISDNPMLGLSLNNNANVSVKIGTQDVNYKAGSASDKIAFTITLDSVLSNLELQRWEYIIISVNDNVVDIYLDGKLLQSQTIQVQPAGLTPPPKKTSTVATFQNLSAAKIEYGKGDIYIAGFERFDTPMDAATAWAKYMAGNGLNTSSIFYGLKATLQKNGKDSKTYTLL